VGPKKALEGVGTRSKECRTSQGKEKGRLVHRIGREWGKKNSGWGGEEKTIRIRKKTSRKGVSSSIRDKRVSGSESPKKLPWEKKEKKASSPFHPKRGNCLSKEDSCQRAPRGGSIQSGRKFSPTGKGVSGEEKERQGGEGGKKKLPKVGVRPVWRGACTE